MKSKAGPARRRQQWGSTLIEVLIASLVLTVGLIGGLTLINLAITSNNRSKLDTVATLLSQSVLEQILAQGATASAPFNVADCAGASHVVDPRGGANGKGNGLTKNGKIDFLAAKIPNYQMNYTVCSSAGRTATYDVRWNVTNWTTSGTTTFTSVVRVAAEPAAAAGQNSVLANFATPVTLKGVAAY